MDYPNRRRRFTREFKEAAVVMALEGGRSVRDVARDLGIHENMLHRWKQEYLGDEKDAFPGSGNLKQSDEDILKLKRRVAELEQEREILKKALAIFSKHPR